MLSLVSQVVLIVHARYDNEWFENVYEWRSRAGSDGFVYKHAEICNRKSRWCVFGCAQFPIPQNVHKYSMIVNSDGLVGYY